MSRVATIEKEVRGCWDCPHLSDIGREPVGPSSFYIVFICTKASGRRVIDIESFPDFCPLEEYEEERE